MAGRKSAWGGPRQGGGRPPEREGAPRRNRVTVLLADDELAKFQRWADAEKIPTGTLAYRIVARALARRK